MHGPLRLVKGALSHAVAAGRQKDHIVAVVEVSYAYLHAEPPLSPMAFMTSTTLTTGQNVAED